MTSAGRKLRRQFPRSLTRWGLRYASTLPASRAPLPCPPSFTIQSIRSTPHAPHRGVSRIAPPFQGPFSAPRRRQMTLDQPLLAGIPRDTDTWPMQAPAPVSAARSPMHRSRSDSALLLDADGEVEPTSCWSKCAVSSCCRPRSSTTTSAHKHKHGSSATRKNRDVDEPPPTPPGLPTHDELLFSPQGAALAQLAGGVWMSQALAKLWPHIAKAVQTTMVDMFPNLVEQSKPSWLESVTLDRFTLGDTVPVIKSVHVDQVDDNHVAEVRIQMETQWHSKSDIQLTVNTLPSAVNKYLPRLFQGVVQYMTSLTVGVQDLKMSAQVLLTLTPLSNELPVVKAVHVSMLRTPDVDFSITVTRGEVTFLNILKPYIRTLVASAFGAYVLPEHIAIPIVTGTPDVQIPEGIVMVRVLKAENVPKMDYFGHSDTYVDTWVRGRLKRRTSVVKRSANPEWPAAGSTFQMLVHTRRFQTLSFELWDEDQDKYDDLIGGASINLCDLQPGKEHQLCLQVFNQGSGAAAEDAPPGLDPAHAGGTSTVNVKDTKLHVAVRYVPSALAHLMKGEIGSPGVFNMKVNKLTVPNLSLLPLRLRPYIIGLPPAVTPPLSSSIYPLQGRDPETGEDLSTRKEIPVGFDAVWDVLGQPEEVGGYTVALELVSGANTKSETVLARVSIPLSQVMAKRIRSVPGGAAGGDFTLAVAGFVFDLTLIWSPLVDDGAAPAPTAGTAVPLGLHQLLHSATNGGMGNGAAADVGGSVGVAGAAGAPAGPEAAAVQHSKSMPNTLADVVNPTELGLPPGV